MTAMNDDERTTEDTPIAPELDAPSGLVLARATIALPGGIAAGHEYWVDPSAPYVAKALAHSFLVPVEVEPEATIGEVT